MLPEEEARCSWAELPADFLADWLLPALRLQDMVTAGATCTAWQRALMRAWKQRCLARWRVWRGGAPPSCSQPEEWRRLYKERHLADRRVFDLLADAVWPERRAGAMEQLLQAGDDAVDVLAAIAHSCHTSGSGDDDDSGSSSSSSRGALFLGLAFHARMALAYVTGDSCAARLQQLLARQQQQAGSVGGDGDGGTLEVALLLMQVLHPLGNVAGVRRIVHELAAELRRRLGSAGAEPGSKRAVQLLNQLLFGQPAAQQQQAAAPAGSADTSSSAGSSSAIGSSLHWRPWWSRDEALDGPDLSGVQVPCDGVSGLGIKGNTADYENVDNACLDSLLAHCTALPITIAILHKAVGNAAGMRGVQLVNMPGHVVNGVKLDSGERLFIDVFNGGVLLDEQGMRDLMSRHIPAGALAATAAAQQLLASPGLAGMSACDAARRCLSNVLNFHQRRRMQLGSGHRDWTGVVYMQAVGVCMMAMEVAAVAGGDGKANSVLLDMVAAALRRGLDHASDVLLMQRLMSRPFAFESRDLLRFYLEDAIKKQGRERSRTDRTDNAPRFSVGERALLVPSAAGQPAQTVVVVDWVALVPLYDEDYPIMPSFGLEPDKPIFSYRVLAPSGQISHLMDTASIVTTSGSLQKLPGSTAGSSPAARGAWAASFAAARTRQLASLQGGWFEHGFVLPPDPPRVCELVAGWPVSEVGRFFEGAWHDEAAGCGAYVPNALLAHRFPDG